MEALNFDLVKRFISDENLPIQLIRREDYFNYVLDLFENMFSSKTKWTEWCNIIDTKYNGNPEAYLADFYNIREQVIQDTKNKPEYIEFNNCDMNGYSVPDIKNISTSDIYKGNNSGKCYLSLDLKKANYQALKKVGVMTEPTYVDWLKNWTQLPHLLSSKYLRVVIFGQLNPKRQITVEKFITAQIYRHIVNNNLLDVANIVSFRNDELIWELSSPIEETALDKLRESVSGLGYKFTTDMFILRAYRLVPKACGKSLLFFMKEYLDGRPGTLHCVPSQYMPIVLKTLEGKPIEEMDTWLEHDGMLCKLLGEYDLIKL